MFVLEQEAIRRVLLDEARQAGVVVSGGDDSQAIQSLSGALRFRLKLKDIHGAFGLGLAYGILSGSCTFGFIAPIPAIIML